MDGLYWKYETFLKKCEGRLGALLGSNGAIYAIRKNLFPVVRPGTLIDDFVIPLDAKRQSGCRIVYDDDAVGAGGNPAEHPGRVPPPGPDRGRRVPEHRDALAAFEPGLRVGFVDLFFHKILRWTCPFFMLGAAVTALFLLLLDDPVYNALDAGQLGFYALAARATGSPLGPAGCATCGCQRCSSQ